MPEESVPPPPFDPDIEQISIEEEMRKSYLDYAMSVIVSRALPDVRDGLKPVHRRILHVMNESNYDWNRPYRKSARVVGDVMGQYHPHGDQAIYDAMVRMAQDFSMRLPLIDGQGNFGSMDGDPPAAMRYTEARLERVARELLDDIDKETVDFQPNYDETTKEPTVLPAKFPNLLVNGGGGIAVGMATNIPPHNLGEVIDACCALIDNPNLPIAELMQVIPGPDFPTGGIIVGRQGLTNAFETGRGSVVMRGRVSIEEIRKDREAIIISEIPYQVNKSRMIERIAEMVRDKKIEGIGDLRDESDRDGVRVVIEIKRDALADVVLNQLYRYSPLQTSFGVNTLALNEGKPELLNLKQILEAFVHFREEVIRRRTEFDLSKARDRAHVLVGLAIAVANIDEAIALIRGAKDPVEARTELMNRDWTATDVASLIELIDDPDHVVVDGRYRLSEAQARAILELRLQRLTGLERDKIAEELSGLATEIEDYLDILRSRERIRSIMRDEMITVKEQFATPRRTAIEDSELETNIEDLIQREEMVVTVSHAGYIKRVALTSYRAQRRGGKGRAGMSTRDEDFVSNVFVCNTHTPVLFFSSRGIVYKLKVYRLPEGSPQARGKALINLLPLEEGETITTVMPMPEDEESWGNLFIIFATASGGVRRNRLSDFTNIMTNGKIAMKLDEGDQLIGVQTCTEEEDILLAADSGKSIRFPVTDVRVFSGRTSTGVRGIKLSGGQKIVSMAALKHTTLDTTHRDAYLRTSKLRRRQEGDEDDNGVEEIVEMNDATNTTVNLSEEEIEKIAADEEFILSVTENGYGKRTSAYEYRITKRGGQGVVNITTEGRNGPVVASFPVEDTDQIMLVTNGGKIIRSPVSDIRIAGRSTQGVTLFDTAEDEQVVSVAHLEETENEAEDNEDPSRPDEILPSEEGAKKVGEDINHKVEVDDEGGHA
ncbi:MAG: DNA gyrase subunit A [Alphaproteobacteria bacterium MarineAlpha11_Bin1]|nr:MAG: DNA gyrase subunit A [Alphaproteobacteria bacterium MarineAlpha11_Bin1]